MIAAFKHYVIHTVSPDGVGVLAHITSAVASAASSIKGGHGEQLGDHFVTYALVEVPDTHARAFAAAMEGLKERHNAFVHRVSYAPASETADAGDVEVLLYAFDHVGLMRNFASALKPIQASIVRYGVSQLSAAHSGAPMFVAKFILNLAPDKSIVALSAALDELADEFAYDFDIQATRAMEPPSRKALTLGELIN